MMLSRKNIMILCILLYHSVSALGQFGPDPGDDHQEMPNQTNLQNLVSKLMFLLDSLQLGIHNLQRNFNQLYRDINDLEAEEDDSSNLEAEEDDSSNCISATSESQYFSLDSYQDTIHENVKKLPDKLQELLDVLDRELTEKDEAREINGSSKFIEQAQALEQMIRDRELFDKEIGQNINEEERVLEIIGERLEEMEKMLERSRNVTQSLIE